MIHRNSCINAFSNAKSWIVFHEDLTLTKKYILQNNLILNQLMIIVYLNDPNETMLLVRLSRSNINVIHVSDYIIRKFFYWKRKWENDIFYLWMTDKWWHVNYWVTNLFFSTLKNVLDEIVLVCHIVKNHHIGLSYRF